MVRLSDFLLNKSKIDHGLRWYQTKSAKVNISWAVLIVVGLGAFVVARNDAIKKRQDQMRYRKALKEQVIREQEASKDN